MTDGTAKTGAVEFDVGGDQQDELFEVLSDPRRRFTLQYLRTVETPLPVSELATELRAWEDPRTGPSRTRDERGEIEIALVHRHLPKMADAGVVTYDVARRTVALTDDADEVDAHLRAMTID